MKKTGEKIKEILTNLEKDSIIDVDSALAVFQSLVKSVDADEVGEFVSQTPIVKAFFDRKENALKTELKNQFETEKQSLESTLASLKEQMPRESDPEKIKQQLEQATDPTEKRLLQLELSNAISIQQLKQLSDEKAEIEKREKDASLKAHLAEIAKAENLPVHDPFAFSVYGEKAEEMMRSFAEKNSQTIEEKIKAMATEKFGGAKMDGADENAKPKLTVEEIEAIPDHRERYKAMKDSGLIA